MVSRGECANEINILTRFFFCLFVYSIALIGVTHIFCKLGNIHYD